jgi:DHA1 family bicyclomycin/chloramphenicol resistance-like MFS transporter
LLFAAGSGLFGAWSDRIGRKIPLFVASAVAAAATFASTAAPNYWFVAAMRGVVGIGAAGQVQGVVLVCMETTGRSFR